MFKPLRIVPHGTNFPFVQNRTKAFIFSLALMLASLGALLVNGLNFGIDFRGGILMEVQTEGPADIPALRTELGALALGDVSIQEFGAEDEILIRIQRQDGAEAEQLAAVDTVKATLGEKVEYRRTEFVGPTVGQELIEAGLFAMLGALGAILIYIWFRFEWQFGVCALIALSHDVFSTFGLFALNGHEFNLPTVAAILTIAGYSINDTVVVFDRVRENFRKYKKMTLVDLFNLSVNETLSRTTMTSLTTLLALLAIYFFGGAVLADFALAMIWGVVIGTYSSVFIAVPLLLYLEPRRGDEEDEDGVPGVAAQGADGQKD
ncbi:protein translocase subunit SecF [Nisaea acidiphila]|uniref:Protein-export membrane protein SecF n=1 Tax=Nisaea acidiphila TaxID=1862145 RepID=A0A9J7AUF1_9PROT|nr:protein translocase subunit SecF [Nisaea acidiphila]UUX50105.1 protein translocase subunit SecF [Nisaea acidiphila]